jgi:16S rRNA (guanine527-N7)-methyltransferase
MDLILHYFPDLSEKQKLQFSQLEYLYGFWNKQINVISRKDIDYLYEHHVLHSLSIAKFFNFNPLATILDVGTGGGFPGIPLAIFFPSVNFTLIDSIGKKIHVVNEIAKSLKLTNVTTICSRVEDVNKKFNFIISRAVSDFQKFVKWTEGKVLPVNINSLPNGIIYLKGGDFENEISAFRQKIIIYNIQDFFGEKFFETKKIIFYPH